MRLPAYTSDDQYAFGVLDEILGSGRSSRLSRASSTGKDPLCTEAQAMYVPLEDGGIFGVFGMLLAGKKADDVEKSPRRMTALAENGVTPEELAKAKTQARLNVIRGRKTAEDIAKNVGEEWLFGNDPNRANTELAKIDKLTVADVQAVAKSISKSIA